MPRVTYRHNCWWKGGREVETGSSRCWLCWKQCEPVEFQWSVVEHWWRFHKRTGLSPLDPKPPEIMAGQITRVCGRCNGEGLARNPNRRIPICPECGGAGGFPVLSAAKLAYAQQYADGCTMTKIKEKQLEMQAREEEWEKALARVSQAHHSSSTDSRSSDRKAAANG